MTTALLLREPGSYRGVGDLPQDAQAGGRLTLEQLLDGVWEGLHAGGARDCPVCRATLEPLVGGRARPCSRCGSIVS